jgi:iron complex transport system substrate-binding protein
MYHPRDMGQLCRTRFSSKFGLAVACLFLWIGGCAKSEAPAAPGVSPRVASVTPAGSDLLIAVGGEENLVAVSNYDDDREGITGKPKIGDYQNVDWEKLASVNPQYLLLQESPDRVPDAVVQRCQALGVTIVNLKIETLADIEATMQQLAQVLKNPDQGKAAAEKMHQEIAAVEARVAGRPKVRTLIVTSEDGLDVVGPGSFLDELLQIAGGENVAAKLGRSYAQIEPEMLNSMAPDAVIQLIPDGDKTPQVMDQARRFWSQMGSLPAVKNQRVYILTDWYSLEPGSHVTELAQEFADCLHPETKQ